MSLIDPSKLPGKKLDADGVATHASTLAGLGTSVSTAGASTLRAWQGISGSYQSDGAEHLYDVMTPVGTASTTVGDGFGAVATALQTYADTVRPIQKKFETLRADAEDFVYRANHYKAHEETTDDIWVKASGGIMGFINPPKVTIDSWDQDQDMVDENNALIRKGADLAEQWLQAQQTCAAAILGAAGLGECTTSQQSPAQLMAEASDLMPKMPWEGEKDIQTPWGSTSGRSESCGEKTLGFPAHLVGGVFEGAFNLVKGVNTLLTGWDGTGVPWYAELAAGAIMGRSDVTDDAWNRAGQTYGAAWLGMGHLASSLTGVDNVFLTLGQTPLGDFLGDDVQQNLTDWAHDDQTVLGNAIGGLVGLKLPDQWWDAKSWDGYNIAQSWVDDPGGTAGESVFNIGSLFIPGGGEASAGLHGADAAGDAARAGVEGSSAATHGLGAADTFIDASKGVTAGDLAGVSKGIDDATLQGIDHLDFETPNIPVNDIKIPDDVAGLQDAWGGVDAPVEHVPADVPAPALVGADSSVADAAHGASSADAAHAGSASDVAHSPVDSAHPSVDRPSTDTGPRDTPSTSSTTHSSSDGTGAHGTESHGGSGSGDAAGSGSHGSGDAAGSHGSTEGDGAGTGGGHEAADQGGDGPGSADHDAPGRFDTEGDRPAPVDETPKTVVEVTSGSKGGWNLDLYHANIKSDTIYRVDGGRFEFHTDELGRVEHAEGHFQPGDPTSASVRHGGQQTSAGGVDRLPGDDGGHLFGARFDPPGEGINITAQLKSLNRGAYRDLESTWAAAIKDGRSVDVSIDVRYPEDSLRPSGYAVKTTIDGEVDVSFFKNSK